MIEIHQASEIDWKLSVPGSKYIANRVLAMASLAAGTSRIRNLPDNEDVGAAISALASLGARIRRNRSSVSIAGGNLKGGHVRIEGSGTLLRFLISLGAVSGHELVIDAGEQLRKRPVHELTRSLADLGARCTEHYPLKIRGPIQGGKTIIDGSISSQFVSSLLIVAPYAINDVEIHVNNGMVSKSYVDMTIDIMKEFGVAVQRKGYSLFKVRAGRYKARDYDIPGDWSSAGYFLSAGALLGKACVEGLDMQSSEAGILELLEKMGAQVIYGKDKATVIKAGLRGIDADMSDMPDAVQTIAAIAVFAEGMTRIRNIGHLKAKESDRLEDTAAELRKLGIKTETTDDSITIHPGTIRHGMVNPHNDHRMAMALSLIGLKAGIGIDDPVCVSKSYPGYWDKLKALGVKIS